MALGETMAADENVAIMRRAYEAFNQADVDTLTELFDESIVWHLPGRSSLADDYQGRDATLAYFGQIGEDRWHVPGGAAGIVRSR
jgi:ketosteroid isomerase-like protein